MAFRIPNLFRRVVGEGATSAAFVPVFTGSLARDGKSGAIQAAASVGGAAMLVLGSGVLLGMLAAGPITELFAPGFSSDPAKAELTQTLTRWTFPYLLFVGAGAWAMGLLNTFRNFWVPALGPILLNLTIILCALALAPLLPVPVYALVVGVLVGGFLQFSIQLPWLWRLGFRPSGLLKLGHPAVRRVGRLILAAVFGGAVYQINILVATVFASLLPARSVSYLWYADRVFEFPLGIVAVAVGTAALPSLSIQAKSGRLNEMAAAVEHSLRLSWALCLPAAVGLFLLAPDIVSLLFERGRFSAIDTELTAWALRAYIPGLLGVAAVRVLVTSFYALEMPRIPVYAAMVALLVNAYFDLALMGSHRSLCALVGCSFGGYSRRCCPHHRSSACWTGPFHRDRRDGQCSHLGRRPEAVPSWSLNGICGPFSDPAYRGGPGNGGRSVGLVRRPGPVWVCRYRWPSSCWAG